MIHASITGWGKATPPAVLSNADLATFLDTDDDWIVSRTGMRERRISHVSMAEMAEIACRRALAAADLPPGKIDLVILGCTAAGTLCPNTASGVSQRLGTVNAAAMDVNTACTSFSYALSTANAMIRTGAIKRALVIGAELVSQCMDWEDRNVAVLFGDGCAAFVLEATQAEEGVLAERLGCYAESRDTLDLRGAGQNYGNRGIPNGHIRWNFDGQEIFKRAVLSMVNASQEALARCGKTIQDIDLVVPHQANLRIIDAIRKRLGVDPAKVFVNVQRYGNMSAATLPVALVEAIEEGRVAPGALLLLPTFGGGLTWAAHVLRFGQRTTPLTATAFDFPPCDKTGLELVNDIRARKEMYTLSAAPFLEEAAWLFRQGRE
jgi:3-oxoacyl-[acyl-carrier-protein] synthase-3